MASIKRKQIAGMNQHYKKFSIDYFLDSQQRAGIESIELWCGGPHFSIDSVRYEDCKALKKKALKRNLEIVSLTIPSCSYQYQYASQEEYHFRKSFLYFSNGIKATAEFGARIMTINSGWGYFNDSLDIAWNRSKEMISRLADIAKQEGVMLAMESLRADESNIVNSLYSAKQMYDEVNHPNLKIMVDTIASGAAGETLQDWFDTFGKDLIHFHFLDGDPYVHNIWGDGNEPLEKQLQCLNDNNYSGYLVQEIADDKYFEDPALADLRNMQVLERFIED